MPAVNVYLPKDRVTSQHQGYGFVEFKSEEDADYVRFKPSSMSQRVLLESGCTEHRAWCTLIAADV